MHFRVIWARGAVESGRGHKAQLYKLKRDPTRIPWSISCLHRDAVASKRPSSKGTQHPGSTRLEEISKLAGRKQFESKQFLTSLLKREPALENKCCTSLSNVRRATFSAKISSVKSERNWMRSANP